MRRTFKLRQDFMPAAKVQWEDDITASVTVPASGITGLPHWVDSRLSIKFCKNVEARFFQRPDDAVLRGYDKQAEKDLSRGDNFISNFEPLPRSEAGDMAERCVSLTNYSEPMRAFVEAAAQDQGFEWFVASDRPRMVDGAPSKNPRYLQLDPCYVDPLSRYLADLGPALYRHVRADRRVMHPVGATLPGRRNNPADLASGVRPLAVYGPIHYQDLPELFMDFVCSLTGKSPSTTGAGSEGALTKGPFNSLVPTTDLNNALLSFILTGYAGYTTAAGHIGRKYRMEHDLSLLVPELWSRMSSDERDADFLKSNGYLERIEDFEYEGKLVPASRLGWRITPLFVTNFLGRIFDTPSAVFAEDMLRPELQSMPEFVDGIRNIAEAQAKSAEAYFDDGSVEAAIPPLKAVLHVMAKGHFEGKSIHDPKVRALFDREAVLSSDWYLRRLEDYREREIAYVAASVERLRLYLAESAEAGSVAARRARAELARTEERMTVLSRPDYIDVIKGSIGLDPLFQGTEAMNGEGAGNALIVDIGELATPLGMVARRGAAMREIYRVEDATIAVRDGLIAYAGPRSGLDDESFEGLPRIDAHGMAVIPGFVDSHTHFIFAGYRSDEFLERASGSDYMEIHRSGGGILSTVRATRAADADELIRLGESRAWTMVQNGVTTVECKSGYGLDIETELRQLEAARAVAERAAIDIVPTYMGLHATGPEFEGRSSGYVEYVIAEALPAVAAQGIARFSDAFCEAGVFGPDECRSFLVAARALGLEPKLHAEELGRTGGAALAAELGAASADHLLKAGGTISASSPGPASSRHASRSRRSASGRSTPMPEE